MLNSSPFCPKPTALCSGLSRCSPSLLSLRRRCHHLLHQKQLIATAGTTSSVVKDSWGLQISQDEDDCVQSTSPLPMPARMGLVLPAIHLQITATTTRHCLHIPNNNSESQWKRMKRVNKGDTSTSINLSGNFRNFRNFQLWLLLWNWLEQPQNSRI